MKTLSTCILKSYLIIWVLLSSNVIFAQIQSTVIGGNWNNETTWIGGVIPNPADDVEINGSVLVDFNTSCNNITINVAGTLQNYINNNYTLNVNGDLVNHGSIVNNVYNFYLNINGNIQHDGTWQNTRTLLIGTSDQDINATAPINCNIFQNTVSTKNIDIASNNLHFVNTQVNWGNCTMTFGNGFIICEGGYFINTNITSDQMDINLLSNAYIQNVVFNTNYAWLRGEINVSSGNEINGNSSDVIVEVVDILQNYGNSNYTLDINGDVVNNGIIRNYVYNFYLNISGTLTNNGLWQNSTTNLVGSETQYLNFSQPFDGTYLNNSNTVGFLSSGSTLIFNNTQIDLNGDTLFLTNGNDQITLNGGFLREAVIIGNTPPSTFTPHLLSGAYFQSTTLVFDEITLPDVFQFIAPMNFYGNVSVQGILRNYSNNNYTAYIYGDVTNDGTITNNVYNLRLYISGNVYQNGIWNNNYTYLSGAIDQAIEFNQPFDGQYLYNSNTEGKIISNTPLIFNNTNIFMYSDTLVFNQTADSLDLNNSILHNAVIIREGMKAINEMKFNLHNNGLVQALSIVSDSIILHGIYQFTGTMNFYGNVAVEGTLRNFGNNNYTANIFGNVTNNGNIINYIYNLTLNITGNIWQHNLWSNYYTYLTGSIDQYLDFYQAFNGNWLNNSNTDGKVIALQNLIFEQTHVEMNNDTLLFKNGADSLSMNGQYIYNAILIREASKASGTLKLNLINNAYVQNLKVFADEIMLYGIFQFRSSLNLHGNITVLNILRNFGDNNYTANIYGNLTNKGSIVNYVYNLSLNITGDIWQNGQWACYYTYLSGNSAQTIHQTSPFTGSFFLDNDSGSDIITTSDLIFNNTHVNLSGASLLLPDKSVLSIQDGYFTNANVVSSDLEFSMNGYYLENVTFNSLTIYGLVQIRNNVIFNGYTTVNGTMQNYGNSNYNLHVNSGITNNGTIQDNVYSFYITAQEDIINKGNWENQWTQLEGYAGSINQTVEIHNGHDITGQLRLFANNSTNFGWHKNNNPLFGNPDYSGATAQVLQFLVPVSSTTSGTYNCLTAAGWSRNIYVNTVSYSPSELDLTVLLEGPFNGIEMNTDLNSGGLLPLSHPYNSFPWNYPGTENVGSIPNAQVVDWLVIECRDAIDADNATKSTRIERHAAFLLDDGSVVGMDGSSNLSLNNEVVNNLFVVVLHRNHLDVMSAVALNEIAGVYSYDFTYDTWNSYGGPLASKNLRDDLDPIYGMMGGDADYNREIDNLDKTAWTTNAGNMASYEPFDFNMNNEVDNQDKNDVWVENIGQSRQVPE